MNRPTLEVADIFRCYGTAYRDEGGLSLSTSCHAHEQTASFRSKFTVYSSQLTVRFAVWSLRFLKL